MSAGNPTDDSLAAAGDELRDRRDIESRPVPEGPVITAHHFKFKPFLGVGKRPCGECGLPYDDGDHIEITILKPGKHYVCPNAGGLGHRSIYTGAYIPELRTLRDHICICGTELVEEDNEQWRVTFQIQEPAGSPWRPVESVQSRHAAEQQHAGLLELAAAGERIRKIKIKRVA